MELRMSRKERDRLKVMAALAQRRMRQKEASRLLRLSERQVRRTRAGLSLDLVHKTGEGHAVDYRHAARSLKAVASPPVIWPILPEAFEGRL